MSRAFCLSSQPFEASRRLPARARILVPCAPTFAARREVLALDRDRAPRQERGHADEDRAALRVCGCHVSRRKV